MAADLVVDSIWTANIAEAGKPTKLVARVKNVGAHYSPWFTSFKVRFVVGGQVLTASAFSFTGIKPGNSTLVTTSESWTPAAPGYYAITVEVDFTHRVPESIENNNFATVYLSVRAAPAPVPAPEPDPVPAPTPVPPPSPTPVSGGLRYGRYFFDHDGYNSPTAQAVNWPVQIRQGNFLDEARAVKAAGAEVYVYATPVANRPTDPHGYTAATLPSDVKPEWLLRDSGGNIIQRGTETGQGNPDGDQALDLGNVELRTASAKFLIEKCKREGWTGVFLDEINQRFIYSYPGKTPNKYPTEAMWQAAQLGYVQHVAAELRFAGFKVGLNLGSDNTPWAREVADLADITMIEYFINIPWESSPRTGAGFKAQLDWLVALSHTKTAAFVQTYSTDPDRVAYALAAFLIGFDERSIFAASSNYSNNSDAKVTRQPVLQQALQLGKPLGD